MSHIVGEIYPFIMYIIIYIYIHLGKSDHDLIVLPHYNHGKGNHPQDSPTFQVSELLMIIVLMWVKQCHKPVVGQSQKNPINR